MPKNPSKRSKTPKTGETPSESSKAARKPPRGPQMALKGAFCDCGGFVQEGAFVHAERCERPDPEMDLRKLTETRVSVQHVPNEDATSLITFEPDHGVWKAMDRFDLRGGEVQGCIVRLRPGPEVDDTLLTSVVEACRAGGALAVRVLPRPKAQTVTNESRAQSRTHWSMREVVAHLVADAHTHDREELAQLVGETMNKVGL